MSMRIRSSLIAITIASGAARAAPAQLPTRLTDAEFQHLSRSLSEPNGFWDSDNLLSNEAAYQRVIPALVRRVGTGGVYLGVGPEQNFTYIAALRPRMAFVLDIREGNALELLMYKALFELSRDRADFVSRLFARRRPAGLDTASTAAALFAAYDRMPPDSALYRATLRRILARLTVVHHFTLTGDERRVIVNVYSAFFTRGPAMDYNNMNAGRGTPYPPYWRGWRPTYEALMTADDGAGVPRSYLATEASYRVVRDLELANLLVPVTGDFAGPHAVRAIGAYLRAHGATVGAFYTSNVEQYLFRDDGWRRFYANVASLPLDSASSFVRAVFRSGMPGLALGPGESVTLLGPMEATVDAVRAGRIASYAGVVEFRPVPQR